MVTTPRKLNYDCFGNGLRRRDQLQQLFSKPHMNTSSPPDGLYLLNMGSTGFQPAACAMAGNCVDPVMEDYPKKLRS